MATNRQLNINGRIYTTEADSDASLLFVLRDHLDLTGSKYGCGEGERGACTRRVLARPPWWGVAPTIGNAIFDAVGVRLRSLPLAPNGVKVS